MPAGRPLQFDPEVALEAAMQTFWSRGYEATALPDLLAATGLSRSSLYQAFGSKQALFERCLRRYREKIAGSMQAALAIAPSAIDFLRDVLEGIADETAGNARRRGCLIMNTAREFNCRDRAVNKLLAESATRMTAFFAGAIRQAQAEGDISPTRDPEALALFFLCSVSGLRNLVQARLPRDQIRAAATQVLTALRV
jgi:TetR/AcrR family transcriptional regulator, transcriptional repressor for nem operon